MKTKILLSGRYWPKYISDYALGRRKDCTWYSKTDNMKIEGKLCTKWHHAKQKLINPWSPCSHPWKSQHTYRWYPPPEAKLWHHAEQKLIDPWSCDHSLYTSLPFHKFNSSSIHELASSQYRHSPVTKPHHCVIHWLAGPVPGVIFSWILQSRKNAMQNVLGSTGRTSPISMIFCSIKPANSVTKSASK